MTGVLGRQSYRLPLRARACLAVLGVFCATALFAPLVAPYDPVAQPDAVNLKNLPPSFSHPFGTDPYSRDVLSRVIYGARLSLTIGCLATLLSGTLGFLYGAASGYLGGVADSVMMRLLDALLAIPRLLLLLAILAAWRGLPATTLILFLGLTGWFGLSRVIRGQVLELRQSEFITAARALGAGRTRIIFRHLLPNLFSPLAVALTLGFAHVIALEAGLSFLGVGVPQPVPSWGNIIQDGSENIRGLWWLTVFPGLALLVTVATLNTLGESLRSAFETRDRKP